VGFPGCIAHRAGGTGELVIRRARTRVVEKDEAAYEAGCAAARVEVAAGRLVYRWSGHAGHWGHWLVTQLAARVSVGVGEGVGVCFVAAWSVSFNEGYNSVLIAEIDRRHGRGAFQALLNESRAQSEVSLWDAKQAWLKRHAPDGADDK